MTTIPSIETATGVPSAPCGGEASAPQTAWTPFTAALDARMPSSAATGERTACAASAARPLAEVAAFPAALEAIAAAPLVPSEMVSPAVRAVSPQPLCPVGVPSSASGLSAPAEAAGADAGRAVSMKSPQGVSSASAQSPQEGAAVSSKPPSPVGVPPSASGLPVPVEMVADADAGRAVSMKPPLGIPSASAQSPQEGAAVSSKQPSPVGVPPSASGLPVPVEMVADADAGRAVSMKPPQGIPSASAQSPQEGAAVSSKPPSPVGVPPSASGLPVPVEMVADADVGRAVSMKPPQGVPSASAQSPQEGAAVSSKPPDPVDVPSSVSGLSASAAVSPKEADETALADAVAAFGVASAPPPPAAGAEAASAPAVSAVEVVEAAFAPSAARAAEPAQVFVEAARAVADTLLVTPGLLRGQGEIRVQLRPDVLDGTEIRVAVEGRQLTVAFTPPTAEMAALIEQCRPQLAEQLAARVHAFQIAVVVRRRARSGEKG